jgi:hypothetical protein
VAEHVRALDAQLVQHRHRVVGEPLLAEVPVGRPVAPAQGAQVRADQPEVAVQALDDAAPDPPVLRPPVQAQHDGRVRRPGLGDVYADAGGQVEEAMLDAGQLGERGSHGATLAWCPPR